MSVLQWRGLSSLPMTAKNVCATVGRAFQPASDRQECLCYGRAGFPACQRTGKNVCATMARAFQPANDRQECLCYGGAGFPACEYTVLRLRIIRKGGIKYDQTDKGSRI